MQTFNPEDSSVHPNDQFVMVQNKGPNDLVWQANGRLITVAGKGKPGARQSMPRWVLQLGLRQPFYADTPDNPGLAQVAPGDADKAFEEEEAIQLQASIEAEKAKLKEAEAKLKALQAQIKAPKAEEPKK